MRLDFRDPDPEVIDLSPDGGAVSTLHEAKIQCTKNDKVSRYAHVPTELPIHLGFVHFMAFRTCICTIFCSDILAEL